MTRPSDHLVERVGRRQRVRNALHGGVLLVALLGVAGLGPWLLFGPLGVLGLLVAGVVLAVFSPRMGPAPLLAQYGAVLLPPVVAPELEFADEVLAARAGLRRAPGLYCLPGRVPGAFTVGGRDAALVVTAGLLTILSLREVVAVLAHEMSHLRAGDHALMRISRTVTRLTTGACVAGVVVLLADPDVVVHTLAGFLVLAVVVAVLPVVVALLDRAFARSREIDADLGAAHLTGDPEALATALEKVELLCGDRWGLRSTWARRPGRGSLLSSHPTTERRTERLRELEPVPIPREPRGWAGSGT